MSRLPTLSLSDGAVVEQQVDVLALLVTPEALNAPDPTLCALNDALEGRLLDVARDEGFEARAKQRLELRTLGRVGARRVLLLGLGDASGKPRAALAEALRATAARAAHHAADTRAERLALALCDAGRHDHLDPAALLLNGAALGAYRFTRYRSAADQEHRLNTIIALAHGALSPRVAAIAAGVYLARDLANEPPNHFVPESFAVEARALAQAHDLECEVLDADAIAARGMNLLLAVGKGSEHDPRLVRLTYHPPGKPAGRLSLVGKGVTFDTGGYTLKPGKSLLNMHLDMSGGAVVLGAARALAELGSAWTIDFIITAAENSVGSRAYKPMDVFCGLGGKTVEISNTDAEGRLCLADAIAYARDLAPDCIVDIATLTGSCMVALGEQSAGLFTDDDALARMICSAGEDAGETFWRLPLDERLRDKLKSPIADTRNSATDSMGGAITAALFLKLWAEGCRWAHLDIAGPSLLDRETGLSRPGGTGFAVATLVELVSRLERG